MPPIDGSGGHDEVLRNDNDGCLHHGPEAEADIEDQRPFNGERIRV